MTIKTLVDFYFAQYKEIEITVEMFGGLSGKRRLYTKEKFYDTFNGWLDETVMSTCFQTHYHNHVSLWNEKCPHPILSITYLSN